MEIEKKPILIKSVLNLNEKGTLIITKDILNKIKYTCNQINKVEWSGVIFYSMKGNITTPKELEFTIEDLFVMNKGTSAHTQFKYTEDIIDIMEHNPKLDECVMGLLHSHNQMNTFFSAEDIDELKINCPNYNQYLSVIVNNNTDICAKAAFLSKNQINISSTAIFKDSFGVSKSWQTTEIKEEYVMYTIDLVVKVPEEEIVEDFFKERVEKVIELADTRLKPITNTAQYSIYDNPMTGYDDWGVDARYQINQPETPKRNLWSGQPKSTTKPLKVKGKQKDEDNDVISFLNYILSEGTSFSYLKSELIGNINELSFFSEDDTMESLEEYFELGFLYILGVSYSLDDAKKLIKNSLEYLISNFPADNDAFNLITMIKTIQLKWEEQLI